MDHHYSDDDLTNYVTDPSLVEKRDELEAHLPCCPDCRARSAEIEKVDRGLRDPSIWRQVNGFLARPRRLEEAMRQKAAIERENADAVRMLTPLLASPIRFEEGRIAESARFRTAGVVRMLCAEANGMHEKRPRFSLQLADAACAIAARLEGERLTTRAMRGLALRERANALRYLGRFADALKALDEAEPLFDFSPPSDPLDRAIIGYVRGSVLVQIERPGDALQVARAIIPVFRDYGDTRRETSAAHLEGASLHTLGRHQEAARAFESVIALARQLGDKQHLAYALQAAAITNVDLGVLERAEQHYAEALVLYDDLDIETEKVRIEWALGSLAMSRGALAEADRLLGAARSDLQRLGLRNDHALATLEWVELQLALNRIDGVVAACREILLQFDSEGMTRNARLALAHLHQALAVKKATPDLVRRIRTYLRELPSHPSAAFVPPS